MGKTMKRIIFCIIFLLSPSLAGATAYTSAAAGNWSVATNWTPNGVPGNGDTATINHAIVADQNVIIGNSPVSGTTVLTLSTGSLTVNSGVEFRLRGKALVNNVPVTFSSGSSLVFDSSAAASPSTTYYNWQQGASSVHTSASLTLSGTAIAPVTITSDSGGLNGIINTNGCGTVTFSHVNISKLGSTSFTTALNLRPGTGRSYYWNNVNISGVYGRFLFEVTGWGGTEDFVLDRIKTINNKYGSNIFFDVQPPAGTTGRREITNSQFDQQVRLYRLTGWTLTNNIYSGDIVTSTSTGAATSIRNNIYLSGFNLNDAEGDIEESFILFNTLNRNHVEGRMPLSKANLLGGVVESTVTNPLQNGGTWITTISNTIGTTSTPQLKNWLVAPAPDGTTSMGLVQMKGTAFTDITIENNTAIITGTVSPQLGGVIVGSGAASNVFSGMIASAKNNLFWIPTGTRSAGNDFGFLALGTSVVTGTAAAGSTDSAVVSTTTLTTGARTLAGTYRVKITSGPDAGLIREVASNTTTTFTLSTPFPNTTLGQTYVAYPLDAITDADYNNWYGFVGGGSIYDSTGVAVTTTKTGYTGFYRTTPSTLGSNDLTVDPQFVDITRSISNFGTGYLGKSISASWLTATAYTAGDTRSRSEVGYFNAAVINYVCTYPHTSAAGNAPGGTVESYLTISSTSNTTPVVITTSTNHGLSTGMRVWVVGNNQPALNTYWPIVVTGPTTFELTGSTGIGTGSGGIVQHSWRNYWEFEGLAEIKKTNEQAPGYNANATVANLLAWVRSGFAPTNAALDGTGYGGVDIGAVDVFLPPPTIGTVTPSISSGSYVPPDFTLSAAVTSSFTVSSCEYTTDGGTNWYAGTVSGSAPNWTCTKVLTGLSDGVKTFNMRAADANGVGTGSGVGYTVDGTGPSDGTLTVTPGDTINDVSWTVATDAGVGLRVANTYDLRFLSGGTPPSCSTGASVYSGTGTSYSHTGLTNGQQYSYRLCAYDKLDNVSSGATESGTPISPPPPATGHNLSPASLSDSLNLSPARLNQNPL